jgi:hypothetical protein
VFKNRVLRNIFGPKDVGGNSIMRNYTIGAVDRVLL